MKFTVIHSYFIIIISFYREKHYTTTPLTMVCTHAGALTVLTSSGRMKTMRKHRNQARRVANRTIRCCLRKSPYRWSRKSARKNTTTTSSASATPLILTAVSHETRQTGTRHSINTSTVWTEQLQQDSKSTSNTDINNKFIRARLAAMCLSMNQKLWIS